MVSFVLLVLSVVAFVVATAIGFGWVTSEYWSGWAGLGLALLAASMIPWGTRPWVRPARD